MLAFHVFVRVQFYDLKNGANIGIKIEKEGKWEKKKMVHFLTLFFKVELICVQKK
jgi:hypothetical protein